MVCARYHCDKHLIKMIVEYAQLMSTAHRVLDGHTVKVGKKSTTLLPGENFTIDLSERIVIENRKCYLKTHHNHPCARWARESVANYRWLFKLFLACCTEYTARFGRAHKTQVVLQQFLSNAPNNIALTNFTRWPLAMPTELQSESVVRSYRSYYIRDKARFAKWSGRPQPSWFNTEREHHA